MSFHQEEGVKFAALYWEEPDRSGHIFGPDNSTAMGKALKEVLSLLSFFAFFKQVSFPVSYSSAQICIENKPTLFFNVCDSVA